MSFRIVIPARYQSTRLSGKLLREINGKPLLQYTYEQALAGGAISVVIATDDEKIYTAAKAFGADVCMTALTHESGTDRLAEVARKFAYADDEIIVNVQGDEPLIPPSLICQVANNLQTYADATIATLCEPITQAEELFNPNAVKVVMDKQGYALYFSRAPIAWQRDDFVTDDLLSTKLDVGSPHYRHIGLYAYRASFLKDYEALASCGLEHMEKLEQLRALWHGYRIHVAIAKQSQPAGVDSLEDFERVAALLSGI